ncbi:MAG: MFS transporter [Propionibacteriaceae bacterium]|jgi:MFS family permease|nr:MFS transporter [Propionibacteriaceae bacterium]
MTSENIPGPTSTPSPGDTVTEGPTPATPLPRLIGVMASSMIGAYIALLTPIQILLTLHLTRICPDTSGAEAAFGLVTGMGALLALVCNPLGGRISDRTAARFGRRRTWILTGGLSGCLVLTAMAWTTQVWQVALVWCAVQALLNFQQAATSALLADQVPYKRRGTVSGFIGLAAAVGPLLGMTAVSLVADPVTQWLVVAGAGALLVVIAVILLRDPQHTPPGAGGLGLKELAKSFWLNPRKHPAFGWAWLVRFLITCAYASGTYNAFFLMERFGVSETEVAAVVLSLSLLTVGLLALASAVSGVISDKIGRQKPFVVAAGLTAAVALVLQAFAPSIAVVYVAVGLLGAGTGLFFAIDAALCVRTLPSAEDTGKDLAVINMANTIPQSLVPFMAPALLALGGFNALYITLALFGVAGAFCVRRLPDLGQEGDPRFAPITRPERTQS